MQSKFEKAEQKKAEIKEHFKRQRRKTTAIFLVFEVAAVALAYILTRLIFEGNYLQWFLVSLFFIVVFPITQYSKKQKELTKAERQQIEFAEQDI